MIIYIKNVIVYDVETQEILQIIIVIHAKKDIHLLMIVKQLKTIVIRYA